MSSIAPGTVLGGRYELVRRVGDDGLIEAWTATDRVLARAVIVELLSPGAGADAADALTAAAGAAARLMHPGIVATYDTGRLADGLPFVVSERPMGPTLGEVLDRHGPLSPPRVAVVGRQIARALEAAHRLRVVHGAVSPATVQLGEDDRAKLAGFAVTGTRSRLSGHVNAARDDVDACARTLVAALVGGGPGLGAGGAGLGGAGGVGGPGLGAGGVVGPGLGAGGVVSARSLRPGVPRVLDAVLVDAQDGGPVDTATALAERLEALDLEDDAEPAVVAERTPPMGTRVTPRPIRLTGSRTSAVAGVVVGLLLAAAIGVAAFVLFGQGGSAGPGGGGGPSSSPGTGAHGGELATVAAHSFDPFGDKTEQEALVNNVRDGNPSTLWSTEEYKSRQFSGLKPGVGVVLLLDGSHSLNQLTVTSPSREWTFSVYVSSQTWPTLDGWGKPVAPGRTVNSDITPVDLAGANGSALLVWITDLGPALAHPPQPDTPFRVDIGELQVR